MVVVLSTVHVAVAVATGVLPLRPRVFMTFLVGVGAVVWAMATVVPHAMRYAKIICFICCVFVFGKGSALILILLCFNNKRC